MNSEQILQLQGMVVDGLKSVEQLRTIDELAHREHVFLYNATETELKKFYDNTTLNQQRFGAIEQRLNLMEPYVKRLGGAVFGDVFDVVDVEANGGDVEAVVV
jgi:hypothetical protein